MDKVRLSLAKSRYYRIGLWVVAGIVILSILSYFAIGFIAADILASPVRDFSAELTPAKYGLPYENITVTARVDGMQIPGWFIPAVNSDKAVIMAPGQNQSRTSELYGKFIELADSLHNNGLNVVMLDLRGHGQSPEAHISFGILERRDIEGTVDWLIQRGFKPGSIGALGISAGGEAIIGAAAEEKNISAVVEESAFADLNPILKAQWTKVSGFPGFLLTPTLWMVDIRYGIDLTRARPVNEVGSLAPRPLLIIHSTTDQIVPVENAKLLQAAYPQAESWILTGPEHARCYNAYPEEYSKKVGDFFNKYLK